MFRHVVMWRVHRFEDAPSFAAALESCKDVVSGMRMFDVGVRTDGMDADYDVILVSAFDDEAAFRAYLEHPHHKQVAARIAPLRASRVVFDFAGP